MNYNNKLNLNDLTSWPFIEAKKILKKLNNKIPKKGYVLFETGYGPSGLPHIGTFCEVVRTNFVKNALEIIAPEIKTKLFCISDDIDAIRKIPDNINNKEYIIDDLGKSLTSVKDPFLQEKSYGEYMNKKLKKFLNKFNFKYEFISATEQYKNGYYNETLDKILYHYDDIMKIMLPTFREERRGTYCPFMPIDPETNLVIDKDVIDIDKKRKEIIYRNKKGETRSISIFDGNCKLQWKVDFAARWHHFDVDYEIYGKDHLANEKIYKSISKLLGGKSPITFVYEMFLGEDGAKISKSKGNGISVDDWLKYSPDESIIYFMYQKPKTAKKISFDSIVKSMDGYLNDLYNFDSIDNFEKKIDNQIFHIKYLQDKNIIKDIDNDTNYKYNNINRNINYNLLLNLSSACNPENEDILYNFIVKYDNKVKKDNILLQKMIEGSINYYNDFIKKKKEFAFLDNDDIKFLLKLKDNLLLLKDDNINESEIQNIIFATGKENGFNKSNIREWFLFLYRSLFGTDNGPKIGSFIKIYSIANFIKLIEYRISNNIK